MVLGLLVGGLVFAGSPTARAAACANVSSFGSIILQVPDLPNDEDQALWIRMQGNKDDQVLAEINGTECLEVELKEDTNDQWTWQTYEKGGELQPIPFDKKAGNTIKLIGLNSGLKIDRVLLTAIDCVPQDFGNNCQTGIDLQTGDGDNVTALASPDGPISGKVELSTTPQANKSDLSELKYSVNGQAIQISNQPAPFDTTLLENGQYTVYITTRLNDGTEIKEMIAVDIRNPENALSPIIRWAKLNKSSIKLVSIAVLGLIVLAVAIKLARNYRKSKRERTFRGL